MRDLGSATGAPAVMNFAVWSGFIGFILVLLAMDLFVLNRKAHVIGIREALLTTLLWVAISLAFNVAVYFLYEHHLFNLGVLPEAVKTTKAAEFLPQAGKPAAIMFFTGYLVELMLSLDNMLVIAMILAYFRVPAHLQHRVLFWGIIGAVVLRGAMIVIGAKLVKEYGHWVLPVFGVVLLLSAVKMLLMREDEAGVERSLIVRASRRVFNVSPHFDGDKFFTRIDTSQVQVQPTDPGPGSGPVPLQPIDGPRTKGKLFLTPLMVSLLVVDVADLIFAVDSIPAIFGITTDPFLVFSSNCFAILGLRSIYFALAALIRRFRYLKVSMVFVLAFIGIKMILDSWVKVSAEVSLLVILSILSVGIVTSLMVQERDRLPDERPIDDLTIAAETAWKRSRKIVILILGLTVVLIAAPLVGFLPGPGGIFVAIGGLALLASEFVWARKLLNRMKAKAMQVTGAGPSTKPPKAWLIPIVLIVFAAFVGLLIWVEREWAEQLPAWAKNVFLLAIGPGIAVGFWAIMTYRRWLQYRKARSFGNLPAGSSISSPIAESPDRQRQRAGST